MSKDNDEFEFNDEYMDDDELLYPKGSVNMSKDNDFENIDLNDDDDIGVSVPQMKLISSNEQYSAYQLYYVTLGDKGISSWKNVTVANNGTQGSKVKCTYTDTLQPIIITPPAADDSHEYGFGIYSKEGVYTVQQAISDAKKIAEDKYEKPYTISTKVAQSRPMFRLFGYKFGPRRRHWTHLEIKVDGNEVKVVHTDSKGFFSKFYSLQPIEEAIKHVFPDKNISLVKTYTAKQSMFDGHNCGRYAVAYEDAVKYPEKKDAIEKDPLSYAVNDLNLDSRLVEPRLRSVETKTTTNKKSNKKETTIIRSSPSHTPSMNGKGIKSSGGRTR